ncbi:MAG: hypothetical protein M1833_006421 [Piccolia ochrophora]|nr:MAG: hypothetical protein M1833_006421 [Piccolia ochrophora]
MSTTAKSSPSLQYRDALPATPTPTTPAPVPLAPVAATTATIETRRDALLDAAVPPEHDGPVDERMAGEGLGAAPDAVAAPAPEDGLAPRGVHGDGRGGHGGREQRERGRGRGEEAFRAEQHTAEGHGDAVREGDEGVVDVVEGEQGSEQRDGGAAVVMVVMCVVDGVRDGRGE